MNILTTLTYYRPHFSGLTVYAELLAQVLGERGHRVTVLTSRHDATSPARERRDGVEIIRLPVGLRVSKGVIMPSMPLWALRLLPQMDALHLHLPQLDAAYLAVMARLLGKPVVLTYHCDLRLPEGLIHSLANQVSHLANHVSFNFANAIVANSRDYAENSTHLRHHLSKLHAIYPPAQILPITEMEQRAFNEKVLIQPGQRIIGMAARLATEKGVEYLALALPLVLQKHPTARVLFLGQHHNVFGEEAYARRLAPLIESLGDRWQFLGVVSNEEKSAFFHACEVSVLPSLNSTESFGIVQIESMLCGTPVIASDIPGIREPVTITGMGKLTPPADPTALAQAIIDVLDEPERYHVDAQDIIRRFTPQSVAETYERLFETL